MDVFVLRNKATGEILKGRRRPVFTRVADAIANVEFVILPGRYIEVVRYSLGQQGESVVATFEESRGRIRGL